MNAKEALELIHRNFNPKFHPDICREYRHTFVFFNGGINVICVDKASGEISEAEMYDLPHENWTSVKL